MVTKVFFGPPSSASRWAMADIENAPDIEYCDFDEKSLSKLKRACLSQKIQKRVPLRIKMLLYKRVLKYKFFKLKRNSKIFFFCSDTHGMVANGEQVFDFIKCLKAWFYNAKFIWHKYESVCDANRDQLNKRDMFDLFLTFNRIDAEKYNIEYAGGFCECGTIKPKELDEKYDLVYCGSGASITRANYVMDIFKYLSDHDWKCIVYLPGMKDASKDYCEKLFGKIEVIEGSWGPRSGKVYYKNSVLYADYKCPYITNISLIHASKAVLEVILPVGLASCTLRLAQEMGYHKKLITNSPTVTQEPFYNENNILHFDKVEDIDKSFLDTPFVPTGYDFTGVGFVNRLCKRLFPEEQV